MRKLCYDLAGAPLPEMLDALLKVVDPDHLLYKSYWPSTPTPVVEEAASGLDFTSIER